MKRQILLAALGVNCGMILLAQDGSVSVTEPLALALNSQPVGIGWSDASPELPFSADCRGNDQSAAIARTPNCVYRSI
jgi:hypothetical protein